MVIPRVRVRWLRVLSAACALGLVLGLASPSIAAEDAPAGWLGVVLGSPFKPADDSPLEPGPGGVPILGVVEDGPAAKAGLRAQDRIVAVDATTVSSPHELQAMIRAMAPDRWVSLTVQRGDDELYLDARLTEHPERGDRLQVRLAWIGVEAIDLPTTLREHFGAPPDSGVMISDVVPAGPADAAGLEVGDVVYEVGGVPVGSVGDLRRVVVSGGVGNTLELLLMRNGAEITLEATLMTRPPKTEPLETKPAQDKNRS